jgi:heavy metal sensor kinase
LLLLFSAFGGYWMSRRALAPVDQIIDATQDIGTASLSSRLAVPRSGDELQRLTETLNAMLDRIEGSFRRITQFTADASHEFRTPIALMRTRAELALRRPRSEAEYRETLEQMYHELVRTTELIERLMTVARADSGVEVLQFRRTDVAALLRAIVEQAQAFAEAKDLHLTSEIPNEPVWVDADPEFLNRLFLILIDNAVKYTPEKGKINVALGTNDGSAELKVTDTGIGIDDSDLPNIFERFYRADKARSRESGGVGLGLAIAKWIAEAHRGSILASSKVGAGSAFVVRIPVSSNGSEVRPA